MEWYTDRRKDEGRSLKYRTMNGNKEETVKTIFLPWRLTRRIGAQKSSGLEGFTDDRIDHP